MGVVGATIGAGVLGAGASIISGNKAADATKDAAAQSNATQLQMYNQTRADQAPMRSVGYGALGKLAAMYGVKPAPAPAAPTAGNFQWDGMNGFNYTGGGYTGGSDGNAQPAEFKTNYDAASAQPYGGFEASPGYQFRVDEATRAIQNSAASRGLLKSGATVKAINRQVQGVASDEYNTYANRLAALAGVGQTATNATNAAGQGYANNVSANQMAAGQATASAYQNTGSAINNGIQNAASGYLYSKGYGGGLTGQYGITMPGPVLYNDAASTIAAHPGIF